MDEFRPYFVELDAPVQYPPRRVVSLVPALTESLYDLGLSSRVSGVTDLCVRPPEIIGRVPSVGMPGQIDVERVSALRPELVIASADENDPHQLEALQAQGLPVWVTHPRSVRDMFNLLWNMMHVFDEGKYVERVRAIEWTCDWQERLSAQREPRSVFVPLSLDPLRTCAADTYVSDLLRICGGASMVVPVAADATGMDLHYPHVTWEQVAQAAPYVILLPVVDPDRYATDVAAAESAGIPEAFRPLVRMVDETTLTWAGTRIAHAFQVLPQLLGTGDVL